VPSNREIPEIGALQFDLCSIKQRHPRHWPDKNWIMCHVLGYQTAPTGVNKIPFMVSEQAVGVGRATRASQGSLLCL
jgi:hypothetical protein